MDAKAEALARIYSYILSDGWCAEAIQKPGDDAGGDIHRAREPGSLNPDVPIIHKKVTGEEGISNQTDYKL